MARILLVENDVQICEILWEFLKMAGHEVMDAADSIMALHRLYYDEDRYDLVIIDFSIPQIGDLEIITELRYEFPDIKIIAISGRDSSSFASSYLKKLRSTGAIYILIKPFYSKVLLDAVDELLAIK